MVAFNEADIRRSIEAGTLDRGRQVHDQGLVIDVDVNSGETVIIGRVRGSAGSLPASDNAKAGAHGTAIHGASALSGDHRLQARGGRSIEALRVSADEKKPRRDMRRRKPPRRALAFARPHKLARRFGGRPLSARAGDDYPAEAKQRMICVECRERDHGARATHQPDDRDPVEGRRLRPDEVLQPQ